MVNKFMRRIEIRVAGVTFENRQEYLAIINDYDPVRIEPEPGNKYDPNALKVLVAHAGEILHVGYVPKELASIIAPHIDGESLDGRIVDITGGFELNNGDRANMGLIVAVDIPQGENGF